MRRALMLTKEEVKAKTHDELFVIIRELQSRSKRTSTNIIKKNYQIKNMRMRLQKIRNSIDYILKTPYGTHTAGKIRKKK